MNLDENETEAGTMDPNRESTKHVASRNGNGNRNGSGPADDKPPRERSDLWFPLFVALVLGALLLINVAKKAPR